MKRKGTGWKCSNCGVPFMGKKQAKCFYCMKKTARPKRSYKVWDFKMKVKDYKKWMERIGLNSNDLYSFYCMIAADHFGQLVDKGKTFKQAEKEGFSGKGLSISQANFAIQDLVHHHVNGEDIRVWWNKENGIEDPKRKGVVVSNILTIPVSKLMR